MSSKANNTRKLPRRRADLLGQGFTWLSAGALAFAVLMIAGLLLLLAYEGMGYFWPRSLEEVSLRDGRVFWGQQVDSETARLLDEGDDQNAKAVIKQRRKYKVGNKRQFEGEDYRWFDEDQIVSTSMPKDLVLLERMEWGNFHGRLLEVRDRAGKVVATGAEAWPKLLDLVDKKARLRERILEIEKGEQGDIAYELAELRLQVRGMNLPNAGLSEEKKARELARIEERRAELMKQSEGTQQRIADLHEQLGGEVAVLKTCTGDQREVVVGEILRAIQPNRMSMGSKVWLYAVRAFEFVWDEPRESNTEGGIFPAIFGTVLMVFLMTFVVTPFGVLAALYLHEYSKGGVLVRLVRIAVNNLAGVPSIVFGVFGLGFFVYLIGGTIDSLFYPEALPKATFGTGGILWASLTLALLTVPVVIVATEEGLDSVPRIVREGSLALGATKFETIYKVVLPSAAPGILTGVILAIARAAGEVAPLMIVGMVKMAPELPLDHHFPFLHLERKFMHLGFHIYDVGFQSPNVEATMPLVYATALLLVVLVTVMNLIAIVIRNHLRKKYATSAV